MKWIRRGPRSGKPDSLLTPLREPVYRAFWGANLVSNFGWLIQGVGAAWLMTSISGSADMVALVQTATQLPVLMFALLAGAAADLWDRRIVLLCAQVWMLAVSVVLALLSIAGMVTPWLLLLFTFMLGAGAAVNGPTMQIIAREIVRPELMAAAVTLNAVAFNMARAVGPAIGGSIIAAGGAQAAFLVNAVTYIPLVLVLMLWRRPLISNELPRERVLAAMTAGVRYVSQSVSIWHTTARSAMFGFAATSVLALLPLVAKEQLQAGPVAFGILLGAFGVGALCGAFIVHPLRQRFGNEAPVVAMTSAYGAALLLMGLMPDWTTAIISLVIMGAGWLGALSSLNIAVQLASARWVQARVLAIYQMVLFGAMALGSWCWGLAAAHWGIGGALIAAGLVMLCSLFMAPFLSLPSGRPPDMTPAAPASEIVPAVPVSDTEGPVMVQIEYRVPVSKAKDFVVAMDEVGHLRQRNGGLRWRLFQDVTDPEHWIETFLVAQWLDFRRLHHRRTAADAEVERLAQRYQLGDAEPVQRPLIARRHDRRFKLDPEERDPR